MGEVVAFKKEKVRKTTLRGDARKLVTECFNAVPDPTGFVVFVTNQHGKMSIRFTGEAEMQTFELLARAEAMAQTEKLSLLHADLDDDEESAGE